MQRRIEVTGVLGGDGECCCLRVATEEYRRLEGEETYQREVQLQQEMLAEAAEAIGFHHLNPQPTFQFYLRDLYRLIGLSDGDKVTVALECLPCQDQPETIGHYVACQERDGEPWEFWTPTPLWDLVTASRLLSDLVIEHPEQRFKLVQTTKRQFLMNKLAVVVYHDFGYHPDTAYLLDRPIGRIMQTLAAGISEGRLQDLLREVAGEEKRPPEYQV